jgi:lysozyme
MAKIKVAKLGDKGNHVQLLQEHLNEHGFELTVDGSFGKLTEKAVKEFQGENLLPPDGIVGPDTWGMLLPEPKDPSAPAGPIPNPPKDGPSGPVRGPRKSREKNLTVPPPEDALLGLDISHHQPKVSWKDLPDDIRFVFLKATEGLQMRDPMFQSHRKGALGQGIAVGAYHFFRPKYSAEAQAESFIRTVGKLLPGELPPVLDLEDHAHLSAQAQLQAVIKWMDLVEEFYGIPPILYASPAFINEMNNPQELYKYPLWIANYGTKAPHIPPPWSAPLFWQCAEQGKVSGIDASGVDHNLFYGNEEDLKALIV